VLRRTRGDDLAGIERELRSLIVFVMQLDAKVEQLLAHFGLDDGEEETDH
jgi:hypothetical protein